MDYVKKNTSTDRFQQFKELISTAPLTTKVAGSSCNSFRGLNLASLGPRWMTTCDRKRSANSDRLEQLRRLRPPDDAVGLGPWRSSLGSQAEQHADPRSF